MAQTNNIPTQQLIQYHNQIIDIQNKGHVLELLLRRKIIDFYQNNGIRLKSVLDESDKILNEHFVVDEGKVKMKKVMVEVPAAPYTPEVLSWWDRNIKGKKVSPAPQPTFKEEDKPIMQDGKTMDDYQKAMAEFNQKLVPFKF